MKNSSIKNLIKVIMVFALMFSVSACSEDEDSSIIPDTFVENNSTTQEVRNLVSNKKLYVYGYDEFGQLGNNEYFIMNISDDGYSVKILDINNSENIIVEDTSLNINDNDGVISIEFDVDDKVLSFAVLSTDDVGLYSIRNTKSLDVGSFPSIEMDDVPGASDGIIFPYLFSFNILTDKGKEALSNYEETLSFNNDTFGKDIWYSVNISDYARCGSIYEFEKTNVLIDNTKTVMQSYPDKNTLQVAGVELTLIAREKEILTFKGIRFETDKSLIGVKFFKNIDDVHQYNDTFNLNCDF